MAQQFHLTAAHKSLHWKREGSLLATPKRVKENFPRSLQHTFPLFYHGSKLQYEVIPEPVMAERVGINRPITISVGGVSSPHPHVEGGCQKKIRVSARQKGGMTDRCQLIKNILSVKEIIGS